MPIAQRMTAAEFVALPVPEHGRPWNLIDGEVVVSDPNARHDLTSPMLPGFELAVIDVFRVM